MTYLPQPPEPPKVAPPGKPPTEESFYVPGIWVWNGSGYAWRAGYWARVQPGWTWVPDHYRWTPSGYVFVGGYWDLAVSKRGILYAPVYVSPARARQLHLHPRLRRPRHGRRRYAVRAAGHVPLLLRRLLRDALSATAAISRALCTARRTTTPSSFTSATNGAGTRRGSAFRSTCTTAALLAASRCRRGVINQTVINQTVVNNNTTIVQNNVTNVNNVNKTVNNTNVNNVNVNNTQQRQQQPVAGGVVEFRGAVEKREHGEDGPADAHAGQAQAQAVQAVSQQRVTAERSAPPSAGQVRTAALAVPRAQPVKQGIVAPKATTVPPSSAKVNNAAASAATNNAAKTANVSGVKPIGTTNSNVANNAGMKTNATNNVAPKSNALATSTNNAGMKTNAQTNSDE